ncbi:hypothetical protein L1987_18695 [Smallanthus sonchifolius]|uniref:Uncharacterized protein n=1 Tax=Smallanthus sonchifolius TaxID=185202 RepID=A0ACB9J0Y9_9ASTR|nr:hypothetical protein L1987_18695 [Smallanthus sonchifolius]
MSLLSVYFVLLDTPPNHGHSAPCLIRNTLACGDPRHPRDLQVVLEHLLLISSVVSVLGAFSTQSTAFLQEKVTDFGDFCDKIEHPTYTYLDEIVPKPISKLDEKEKKVYDSEKKAHGSITMALTIEIFHSFRGYYNSKDLWKALQKRFEGNSDIKKSKRYLLRKQFYHLHTELKAYELTYPDEELVEKFLDALPPNFEMYTTLLRENPEFYEMTIEEAIGKVQAHDMNLKRKESSGRPQIQNPSMYYGTSSTAKSSESGSGPHHQHSSRNPTSTSSANQTAIAKIAEDHVALFASCMLAYENFIGGKLMDPETIKEDFNQVDPDDMEDMNIQWNMAMILRWAKRFLNRTGRKFIGGLSNAKVGFDKSKSKCYKCQNFGQFARECQKDKAPASEDALIAQTQVGFIAEIVEMMEAEEREAFVADQKESTTAFALMAIGEASSSSTEVDCNSFPVISCSKCLGLKVENSKLQDKVESLRIAALSYKENEKRYKDSTETLKKKNLDGKIVKLKNSRFVVENYELVVRQVSGLGLGTNAIPPPVSGKFVNGLIDLDLSCLDDSSNMEDSSSKADSVSDEEFFSDEGSENTKVEGVVSEDLLDKHNVKKPIVTDCNNCILTEPDVVETNDKIKMMLYGGFKSIKQITKEAFANNLGKNFQ